MARQAGAVQAVSEARSSERIFFTIVAWNYIAYAATLMESIARTHPRSLRRVIVCDRRREDVGVALAADILHAEDLAIPDVAGMAFAYGVMEFATALKPFAFLHFLAAHPGAHVSYIDPDILVTRTLTHVFDALEGGAGMVLTPHVMRPLQDGRQPDDLTIMKSGVYNLGFLAVRGEAETLLFVKWWADRCRRDAVVDIANHKFTDQRWVDLAPAFVGAVHILRHPGYNIAYWNLSERHIEKTRTGHRVNGEAIHFLHFSGVVPSDPTILSRHQNRFELPDLPAYAGLHRRYLKALLAHGWRDTAKIAYGFDAFADGRPIHPFMRASFRRHEGAEGLSGSAAFASDGALFDLEEPTLARHGPPAISRAMYELWMARIDLRRSFALDQSEARARYLNWFIEGGFQEAGFDTRSQAAAERLRADFAPTAVAPGQAAPRRAMAEPWRKQAPLAYDGPPEGLEAWLCAPVALQLATSGGGVYLPRFLALLWEARADLRCHFQLQDAANLEAYLAWCLTRGVQEGNVPIDMLGPALARHLNGVEGAARSDDPTTPPRTRLLRMVRSEYRGAFRELIERSPLDERAQLAEALWLCGPMRAQHEWPPAMVARPLEWLQAPCGMQCGGNGTPLAIPNIIHACYRLRRDVQDAFDAATEEGRWRIVAWFVAFGSREFALAPLLCGADFLAWLGGPAAQGAGALRQIDYLVWLARPDVRDGFPLDREGGGAALRSWMATEAREDGGIAPWLDALDPPDAVAPAGLRCDICLTGLWGAASGRGEDIRLTAAALRHQGIDFVIFDRRGGRFFDAAGAPAAVDAASVRINIVHLNADTALWDYIALRKAGLTGAYAIGYWAWELERLPEAWNFAFSLYREVWASTRFAQQAFQRSGRREVLLMPMAVDLPAEASTKTREDFGLATDEFVFYYGFDYRSYMARKNPEAAIVAFLAAFGAGRERVRLVLKTLGADDNRESRDRIAAMAARDDRITLLDAELDRPDLFALIGACDCYVSPHRSEGFGRGPAEAMLLGLPVIATGYSGNMDFTTRETALVVDYRMTPVPDGAYPGGNGQMWAEIDGQKLAKAMRLLQRRPSVRRLIAEAGKSHIAARHSIHALSTHYATRIQGLPPNIGVF